MKTYLSFIRCTGRNPCEEWCEEKYGTDDLGHVTVTRGNRHDYLAMTIDYSKRGKALIDMTEYIDQLEEDFPEKLEKNTKAWSDKLLSIDKKSKRLCNEKSEIFHSFVMKIMFLCKRGRPDVELGVSFLSTRISESTEQDYNKLIKLLSFIVTTRNDALCLEVVDSKTLTWYVDAAFAVHADMRSHTGSIFTLGKGSIISGSSVQKRNARSSTESEINGVDDKIAKIIWTKKFVDAQDWGFKCNVIMQDNTSTIKLLNNGRESAGKRTRHLDIRLFYVKDLVKNKEVEVVYCPTEKMIADHNTKPLVGAKFKMFRDVILNLSGIHHTQVGQQECVEQIRV